MESERPRNVPARVSLAVVSLNEERNLRRCLESVRGLCDEIVVVDSGSADGTETVARDFGAVWAYREWDSFHGQKNAALGLCRGEWVLSLDCDEALSAALRDEISAFLESVSGDTAGAEFPRCSHFLGRWIRHGEWYPDWSLRLLRRGRAAFGGGAGHDRAKVEGRVERLQGELLHYSYPTINSYIEKMNAFSDAFLAREIALGRRWRPVSNVTRPLWRFFRGYVVRGGVLDGFPGLWIAAATAFAAFVRYSRLYEWERCESERARIERPRAQSSGERDEAGEAR